VERAVSSTKEGLSTLSSLSAASSQVAASSSSSSSSEPQTHVPPVELEIGAIKAALDGTQQSMQRLEEELSQVTASLESIEQSNKFSLFLHKFYLSLHKHMDETGTSLQDVFVPFDANRDGCLSSAELEEMLCELVPDSAESDRKSLVFFLDPMNEGQIHYGTLLQNAGGAGVGFHDVTFRIEYFTEPNQHIRISGGHEDLGWWRAADSPQMYEVEHGTWEAKLSLPGSTVYEYKYVVCDRSEPLEWLPGSNLVLELPPGASLSDKGARNGNGNGNGGGAEEGKEGGERSPKKIFVEDKWHGYPSTAPFASSVNTRSNIIRILSAAGSPDIAQDNKSK